MAARALQRMQDATGRDGEAQDWDKDDCPPAAKAYYLAVLKDELSSQNGGLRSQREAHTMCVILDHLAQGRPRAAADTAAMRLFALELAARKSWEEAQHLEIVPPEGSHLVTKDLQHMAAKEAAFDRKLQGKGLTSVKGGWQNYDGKGKGAPWGQHNRKGKDGKGKKGKDAQNQDGKGAAVG